MDFHHPLVQGLALPLLLGFALTGLARGALGSTRGARWAAAGAAGAIVATAGWILGWAFAPGSLTEKLPWACAGAALAGLGLEAVRAGRRTQWLAASLLWALMLAVLADQPLALRWQLAGRRRGDPRRAERAGAACRRGGDARARELGLAGAAMMAGSALLFELSLALGAAVAGCAVWLWPKARIAFGAAGAVASVLVWLALAHGTAVLTTVSPGVLLLLCGAFTSGAALRFARHRAGKATARPWVEALVVAAVAALWVAAALGLSLVLADGAAAPAGNMDDPYYKPRW
ncbi:MAG: hypothetical protein WKG52_01810 [Variovorax sp.]